MGDAKQAEDPKDLERRFMDYRIPGGSERWWAVREIERLRDALRNLLAVIHHDGGHYATAHGDVQAAKDAEKVVLEDRAACEARGYLLDEHRKSCSWEARATRAESEAAGYRVALENAAVALDVAARNIVEAAQIIRGEGNGDWQIVEATSGAALLSAESVRKALSAPARDGPDLAALAHTHSESSDEGGRVEGLPVVAGRRVERTLSDLNRAARVLIKEEQEKIAPDSRLIGVLCDTVRLIRENVDSGAVVPSPDAREAAVELAEAVALAVDDGIILLSDQTIENYIGDELAKYRALKGR